MKKLNFLFGALLLASTSVFTSCFSNDIPSIVINGGGGNTNNNGEGVKLGEITQSSNYSYSIICNVAADIRVGKSFDDVQKVSSTLSYTGKGGIGEKVYIVASTNVKGYSTDKVKKEVTLDSNGKIIYITFAKNPSEQTTVDRDRRYAIPLSEAKEKTADGKVIYIENTEANKKEPYPAQKTDLKMYISNQMTVNAMNQGTPGEALYTITAKEVDMNNVNANTDNVHEWFPVLKIMCKPDGAQFGNDNPARVVATNIYFDKGMNFQCIGAKGDAAVLSEEGGAVTMEFTHFSDYVVETEVDIERTGNEREIKTQTLLDCKIGNHTYNYFIYTGCHYDYYGQNGFIDKYLESKFGKKDYSAKGEFTVSNLASRATIPYTVTQKEYEYRVLFGNVRINVWVYGPEELFVDEENAVIYDATKHSGGSAF